MTFQNRGLGTVAVVLAFVAPLIAPSRHGLQAANTPSDLPAVFEQARVVHLRGRHYFPAPGQENGTPLPPVEMDTWLDRQTGCTRETQMGMSARSQKSTHGGATTSSTVTVIETICDGTYLMTVDHAAKTATFTRIGNYYRDLAAHRLSQKIWSQLCGQATPLENFVKVGRETLEGSSCDIWQLDAARTWGDGLGAITMAGGGFPRGGFHGPPGYSMRSKLWVSADNEQLRRAQAWTRMQSSPWELRSDYQSIECNGQVPPGVFTTEPPASYTARNSKATAPLADLRRGSTGMNINQRGLNVQVAFTLDDGSVVVGWQSLAGLREGSQEPLFAKLTCGGPLPKLPLELYGLRPAGPAGSITYAGRHLGYTRQADRFTEWGLYVPSGTPPALVKQAGYNALYRFNPDFGPNANAQMGFTVEYGVRIKTAADFDKWVGGAMAELSDDGRIPDALTYQKVYDLARQIRTPVKP